MRAVAATAILTIQTGLLESAYQLEHPEQSNTTYAVLPQMLGICFTRRLVTKTGDVVDNVFIYLTALPDQKQ